VPADTESNGGSEAAVRVAKADLVPTDGDLLDGYRSWAKLVKACETFTNDINSRVHRVTRLAPFDTLADETITAASSAGHRVHRGVR